jgi:pimeloyl-ACP methyl ester carboxylesterase
MRSFVAPLSVAVLAYLGLCAAMFVLQRSMIYLPPPGAAGGPVTKLSTPTTALWVSTRPRDGPEALIYFGGNAEDVSLNLQSFAAAFPDRALYLHHYRGYGGSPGRPSEAALHEDAVALFDLVQARHPDTAVMGRSLGAAVAVRLASRRPVSRLLLVTPFDSLVDLAARHYPIFPVRWLLRDRFESRPFAPVVQAPTLLVAAEHDEIVPRASTELLLSRFASGVATLKVIPRTHHNDLSDSPLYLEILQTAL